MVLQQDHKPITSWTLKEHVKVTKKAFEAQLAKTLGFKNLSVAVYHEPVDRSDPDKGYAPIYAYHDERIDFMKGSHVATWWQGEGWIMQELNEVESN